MVQPNYQFRALTTNAAEARTVRDAFARSVLWGFPIAAATGDRVLVDFTEYLVRDGNDMASRLRPGSYRFDATRSSIYAPMTLGFPEEHRDGSRADVRAQRRRGAGGGRGGGRGGGGGGGGGAFLEGVGSVAATAEAASIRIHHSIVELPDANYKTRRFDPRSGFGSTDYENYAALPGQPMTAALHPPSSPAEERSVRRGQRTGQADHLLPRPRRARADPLGAPRRRALVEPGVRGGRLSRRLPRRAAARGRQPARHPLQRDQLGASIDARLEHRRQRERSAHGRDHQGRRHARLAPHPPGLHDRGGAAQPLQGRHRDAEGADRVGTRAHPPALGARGRPHARDRPQLLQQHGRTHLGHGLPASARHDGHRRHARLLEGLRRRHRRLGQGRDHLRATRTSLPAPTRRRRSRRSSRRDTRRICGTSPTRTPTRIPASTHGRTAPTPPRS